MNDRDLAALWGQVRKGESETAFDTDQEALLLKKIADAADLSNTQCPNPAINLKASVLESIKERARSPLLEYLNSWKILAPTLVSLLLLAFVYLQENKYSGILNIAPRPTPTIETGLGGRVIRYNDARVVEATNGIVLYLTGSAQPILLLLMVLCALIAAHKRYYKIATFLLIVATAIFIGSRFLF